MKQCDINKTIKTMIKEEFISVLKEIGVPCGSCGKKCPCETICESPMPTGFLLPNGTTIQSGAPGCGCGNNADETPKMPENQVNQFGNTPPFPGVADNDPSKEQSPSIADLQSNDQANIKQMKILKLLMKLKSLPKTPSTYNGQPVILNKPKVLDGHLTLFTESNGIVKEYRIKIKN